MNNFFDTEDGKIMRTVVHDHCSGISVILNYVRGLEHRLEKRGEVSREDLEQALEGIRKGVYRTKEAVDYGYVKFKEKNQEK